MNRKLADRSTCIQRVLRRNIMRILIVEDDQSVAETLRSGLSEQAFTVKTCATVNDALDLLRGPPFDLILLDLGLPGRNGFELLAALRTRGKRPFVIILTARGEIDDRVTGLDCGADDYVVKPFSFTELLARIRAVLRRPGSDERTIRAGSLDIDLIERKVSCKAALLDLTQREFELLVYFAKNAGQVVSRDTLCRDVWHIRSRATSMDNVIDVNVSRLRNKLIEAGLENALRTVRGIGYILDVTQ